MRGTVPSRASGEDQSSWVWAFGASVGPGHANTLDCAKRLMMFSGFLGTGVAWGQSVW